MICTGSINPSGSICPPIHHGLAAPGALLFCRCMAELIHMCSRQGCSTSGSARQTYKILLFFLNIFFFSLSNVCGWEGWTSLIHLFIHIILHLWASPRRRTYENDTDFSCKFWKFLWRELRKWNISSCLQRTEMNTRYRVPLLRNCANKVWGAHGVFPIPMTDWNILL